MNAFVVATCTARISAAASTSQSDVEVDVDIHGVMDVKVEDAEK